jgi:hypothetical protein
MNYQISGKVIKKFVWKYNKKYFIIGVCAENKLNSYIFFLKCI